MRSGSAPTFRSHRSNRWLPWIWILLLFVSNFKLRTRSVISAVQGVASLENLVEFGAYALAAAAASVLLGRRAKINVKSWGLWFLLAFGLLGVGSALWSDIPLFTFFRGFQVLAIALLARATAVVWRAGERSSTADWSRIWVSFLILVCLLGVWGLVMPNYQQGGRFAWGGMHTGVVGMYLGSGLIIAIALLGESGSSSWRRFRPALAIAAVFCGVLLILTVTRSVLAGVAMALAVLFVLKGRRRSPGAWLAWASMATVGFLAVWAYAESIATYVMRGQSLEQFETLSNRTDLWGYAIGLIAESPLLGHGYGSARVVLTTAFPWGGTGHNLWVESAVSLGLVGAFIVTGFMIWLLRVGVAAHRTRPGSISAIAVGLTVLLSVSSVGGETYALPRFEMSMVALCAAALSALQITHRSGMPQRRLQPHLIESRPDMSRPYGRVPN